MENKEKDKEVQIYIYVNIIGYYLNDEGNIKNNIQVYKDVKSIEEINYYLSHISVLMNGKNVERKYDGIEVKINNDEVLKILKEQEKVIGVSMYRKGKVVRIVKDVLTGYLIKNIYYTVKK